MNRILRLLRTLAAVAPGFGRAVMSGWLQIGVSVVAQGISVPLYLTYLTKPEFGLAMMLNAFVTFSSVGAGGIWSGGIQYLGERAGLGDKAGFATAYRITRIAYVGYGMFVASLFLVAAAVWPHSSKSLGGAGGWKVEAAVVLYLLLVYRNGVDRIALFARAEIATANATSIVNQIVFISVLPVLLAAGFGLAAAPLSFAAGLAASQLMMLRHWRISGVDLRLPPSAAADPRSVLSFLFGRVGTLFQIQGMLSLFLASDVMFVGLVAGPSTAAEFALLWKMAEVGLLIIGKAPEALQPHLIQLSARQDHQAFSKLYLRGLGLCVGAALAGGGTYAVLGPWIVGLWVGRANVPAIAHGYLFAGAALVVVASSRMPMIAAMAKRDLGFLVSLMALEAAAKFIALIALLAELGAAAPVAAWTLVHVSGIALLYQGLGYSVARRRNSHRPSPATLWSFVKSVLSLGLKPIAFVLLYRLSLRIGLWRHRMPIKKLTLMPIWREAPVMAVPTQLSLEAKGALHIAVLKLMAGDVELFGETPHKRAAPPCWLRDPQSLAEWPTPTAHWSKVNHFGASFDIKNLWDAARFWWAPALAAEARSTTSLKPLATLDQWTRDFLERNPLNQGPQWSCGQETSIRAVNLLLATVILEQDEEPAKGLVDLLIAHARRVRPTIFYAIGQMNNHAISEAAGLFLVGEWLAKLPHRYAVDRSEALSWATAGRDILEAMVEAQIAPDGGHVLRSVGYQRAVLDTLSVVEALRRRWEVQPFTSEFYARAYAATDFLFTFVEPASGQAPQLGAIDGSRGFDLAFIGVADYRPTVQLAMALFGRGTVYPAGPWDTPLAWLQIQPNYVPCARKARIFSDSGYVFLTVDKSWGVLVLPRYRIRASHADGLHLDLWHGDINWLADAGTRSYFSSDEASSRMNGVWGHNTVSFDDDDQMDRRSRFLYTSWPKGIYGEFVPSRDGIAVQAEMTDWRGRRHVRRVQATPFAWTITDSASGLANAAHLRWRLRPGHWLRTSRAQWRQAGAEIAVISSSGASRASLSSMPSARYYGDVWERPTILAEAPTPAAFITRFQFRNEAS